MGFESLFEFFFKYKPFVFERGDFVFAATPASFAAAALLVAVAVPIVRQYRQVQGNSTPRHRLALMIVRAAVVALGCVVLLRPSLVVATAVPQQNFVGVLVDDSRSMQIADGGVTTRAEQVSNWLNPENAELIGQLEERFRLRLFSFSDVARRLDDAAELRFSGLRTDVAGALEAGRQELGGLPLSGLVLLSDGADNDSESLTETLNALRQADVPVFAVGVGEETFARDIEVSRVEAPRDVMQNAAVGADVVIRQRGFEGETVQLYVEDGGRIVSTMDVELPRSGDSTVVRARFVADEAGPRIVTFRIDVAEGEVVCQNNALETLVTVRDEQARILYFEGEPRHEVGFIRRALHDDRNIALATLVRSAPNKFQSLIVDPDERFGGEHELFGGFPKTREELYRYSAVVLGSVEADYFTRDQLQMIDDFVSQRGGGLLALGGRRSFAEGGYAGTPVAETLPVVLDPPAAEAWHSELQVAPTLFGRTHPVTQFGETSAASAERWETMPPLLAVNRVTRAKPGAAILLEGTSETLTDPQVMLAYQRYGAGKSIALTAADTWQWQMHYDMPLDDMTHENFWRQMLRWLVADVAGQVRAQLDRDRFAAGETVTVQVDVFDDTYLAVNDADVAATVAGPDGREEILDLAWTVDVDGRYEASFTAAAEGFYQVDVTAVGRDADLGSDVVTGQAAELTQEFFGAEMNRELLARVAEESGGRFYTAANVDELPGDITFTEGGTTVTEVLDLWDMPLFFFLFVGLVGSEWTVRKLRRLA
ncbi:MAG: hypothetical protein GKS06_09335 [Acidobacteria bacterium]|nr:hypothetical protein [Acidobacteriota bacterium]